MSRYQTIDVKFTSRASLESALDVLALKGIASVRSSDGQNSLVAGGAYAKTPAAYVISRFESGGAYEDIAIVREDPAREEYHLAVSAHLNDQERRVIGLLKQEYGITHYSRLAAAKGFTVSHIQEPGGVVRLRLVKH